MNAITNMARLTRAGAIIAWSGARVLPDEVRLPPPLGLFRRMTAPLRQEKANGTAERANEARALDRAHLARAVLHQARPVPRHPRRHHRPRARRRSRHAAGSPAALLARRGAQGRRRGARARRSTRCLPSSARPWPRPRSPRCTRRRCASRTARCKPVAVKVLRPGIEQRFNQDLDSYFFAARMIERFHPPSRRLRPDGRGRHAGEIRRHRDGSAHGGRRHLRDGREHPRTIDGLPRAGGRLERGARGAC